MKLTNKEIYVYASNLLAEFNESKELKLPIKLNFYLQKNIQVLQKLAVEIENNRLNILKEYGTKDESENTYIVPDDKIAIVNKELNDLFDLEQEVQIYTVSIDALGDELSLTMKQMEALMFMID